MILLGVMNNPIDKMYIPALNDKLTEKNNEEGRCVINAITDSSSTVSEWICVANTSNNLGEWKSISINE